MEELQQFNDEEYLHTLESILAYVLLKHYKGVLRIAQTEWEAMVGPLVGGSLNVLFDNDIITVTISGNKDAKA